MQRPQPSKATSTASSRQRKLAIGRGGRLAIVATAVGTLLALPLALPASAATAIPVYVAASAIGTDRATGATPNWFADISGAGAFATTTDAFDGISPSLKLTTPGSGDQVRVLDSYGPSAAPTIPALLNGASYTYTGSNANFQIEIFFTPKNLSEYGPAGTTSACTPAKDGATIIPDQCYTVLKWEPLQTPSGTWKTVDLTADTALASGVGGWKNTNVVGIYPKPGAHIGNTLSEYLDQIASYQVLGAGVALGSGTVNGTSWIKNLTFGGTEYRFGSIPTPAPAAAPPAADSASLTTLLATDNVDVAANTNSFVPDNASSALGAVDSSKPFSGSLPWASNDNFVDVYAYSAPILLGTFPVVDGKVMLTNLDLSKLAAGSHHLVFLGQNSGALSAVALTVSAQLAVTGVAPWPLITTSIILLGTGAVLVIAVGSLPRRKRHADRAHSSR
jgi:hypothetical protein